MTLVRSWLAATCSSAASLPQPPSPFDRAISSESASTSASSSASSSSCSSRDTSHSAGSIQTNLSLQTLPSVLSLQGLSPEALHLSVSHHSLAPLRPHAHLPVTCIAAHGDLLYAASGYVINVYTVADLTHLVAFNDDAPSTGSVKSIAFSDGRVFTAHQDAKIRVWQVTESKGHRLVATLPTVNDRLRRFILPKNYVSVRRHRRRLWIEHVDAVTGLAVNNGFMYSVSWDKSLKIWRPSGLRCLESVRAHQDAVNAVAVAVDGTVYTGSADRKIRVWTKPVGEKRHALVATLEKHKSAVNALALSEDGSVLFSGSCDRSILVWEKEDSANHMAVTGALRGHGKAILCLINVSDLLFSGSFDRTVRVWQRGPDGRYCCLSVLDGNRKPVKSLVAVPNGEGAISVFVGSLDGEINAWQVSVSSPSVSLSEKTAGCNEILRKYGSGSTW